MTNPQIYVVKRIQRQQAHCEIFRYSTGSARQCRLAWRIGCEFGAEFVDSTEQRQFGRRQADVNQLARMSAISAR
jgi:hypothetical protein